MGTKSKLETVPEDVLPLELLGRFALSRALHEYEESESSVICERSCVVEILDKVCGPFEVRPGEEILWDFKFSSVLKEAVEASDNGC